MAFSLTDEQSRVAGKDGRAAVMACPGSGKTAAVAAWVAHKLAAWPCPQNGIAVLSFTNVAADEIAGELSGRYEVPQVQMYPHFVGTIDSFVNRYIFLPFGRHAMGSRSRPEMVGPPFGTWLPHHFFDKFRYGANGTLTLSDQRALPADNPQLRAMHENAKRERNTFGFATQSDADYFAMRTLELYPVIAKALAVRFPSIVVDEAQDSSEVQMRILDILVQNGARDLLLIGDPDQAIFEWRDAKPDLLRQKAHDWQTEDLTLTGNQRSSQAICDCTWRLTIKPGAAASVCCIESIRSCSTSPELWCYARGEEHRIPERFLAHCRAHDIKPTPKNTAMLFRSSELMRRTLVLGPTPHREVSPFSDVGALDLLRLKRYSDGGMFEEIRQVARITMARLASGRANPKAEDIRALEHERGPAEARRSAYELACRLPSSDCDVAAWCRQASTCLVDFCQSRGWSPTGIDLNPKRNHREQAAADYCHPKAPVCTEHDCYAGTIHSAKGKTFDATLLLLGSQTGNKHYATLLKSGIRTDDDEELRNVYVALTRPRRVLVLAVPEREGELWASRLGLPVASVRPSGDQAPATSQQEG